MDYNSFKEKIYYMNLKEISKYYLITAIVISFSYIVSFFCPNFIEDLFDVLGLIVNMLLLMFSIHLEDLTGKKIYKIVQIFFIINCINQTIVLTPDNYFELAKKFLNKIEYSAIYNFRLINRIVIYYFLAKYRNDYHREDKIYVEYLFVITSLTIMIYINSKLNWTLIDVIYTIIISILLILSYRYSHLNRLRVGSRVDLFRINITLTMIDYIIRIISNIVKFYSIDNISGIAMEIVFIATLIAVIFNIKRENYNFVFKETVKTTKYLERINEKTKRNNYKLEEAYKKLKEKQDLYKEFLEKGPNSIVIINSNLRIIYCNSNFLNEINKENLRQVVNKKIYNYIDFKNDLNEIKKEANLGLITSNIKINNKDMELRLFNLDEDESEYIILLKDLTEKVKLAQMKEELENIKIKDKIKKNFLSNISHDLKIPVNVIYSAIQLEKILINNNNIEKIKMYNDINKENCFILTKLTNNLIDISKINSENLESNMVLDNIVEFLEDYLFSLTPYINNSKIELIFDTDEEEIYIYFDKDMMQRVILNLISNSIKFINKNGLITIKIKDFENHIEIELSDNGIGMSKDFVNKAFDKYQMEARSKINNPTGFGVGLFVVYKLIKAQNGCINIESEVGKGTTFVIKLNK